MGCRNELLVLINEIIAEKETNEFREKLQADFTTASILLKDREYGEIGKFKLFNFQYSTRRFYNPLEPKDTRKKYGWIEGINKKSNSEFFM